MCRHAPIVLIPFSPGTLVPMYSTAKRKTRRHNAKQRTNGTYNAYDTTTSKSLLQSRSVLMQ